MNPPDSRDVHAPRFLARGGEMGARMRAHDWSSTPLGPAEIWPQSLKSAVSIMLNSRFPIALYWGPELALVYNDAWSPILGEKHPWALGRPGRDVWPEIWDTIGPLYERVISTGEGVWQEDELLPMHRRGYLEECYYNFTFSPIAGEDGRVEGIFNAVVETTERVLSERRLRTLSRMGGRADVALSIHGACRWVAEILAENTADLPFALIYTRHKGEVRLAAAMGLDSGSALAPFSLLRGEEAIWPIVQAEATKAAVITPAPDALALSEPLWPEPVAEVITLPVIIAGDDQPSAFLVAGANPRRRIDAGYKSFFELAAGHVATAVASARAYEEQRERAEALAQIDRDKTAFFSNVSHEFRTPLTLMLGPLEDALAEADALPAEQQDRLGTAHRNAQRLLRLVNALLDFSRIEAGRVQASFRSTDLAALTAELVSSFRSATDKAGLRLRVDTPSLSQPAYVDADMWEKIVLNLVSNAFKFTFEGEIEVTLREVGDEAHLVVRDTGVGIPASELPRLFERFHRVEGVRGRSFEGSGIGLALVQELVKQHGGSISVRSEESRGTTLDVALPLGVGHLPQDRIRAGDEVQTPSAWSGSFAEEALRWLPGEDDVPVSVDSEPNMLAGPLSSHGARPRVLLADDNADLRNYITRILKGRGYEVEPVGDGEAALGAARANRPDVLITDVMMPRLDGLGLLQAIREDAALHDLPVIILSARAGEEAAVQGLDAGADDYLTKPFSARDLLARVASNVAMARLRRDSEERLREVNATLEARVEERTRELLAAEEALRQSQKMEAVGQLTGGIAHDFNNLLTIITGNVDMARRALAAGETSRAGRAMDNAQKGAERAAALTQRLLAFSRRQPLTPKPINVDRLVGGMSDLLNRALGETVGLEVVTSPGLWRVEADPNQLESAILNLAVNARDAMAGGGKLTIETANARLDEQYSAAHAEVAPGNYVVIAVSDTGHGMDKETVARVFDPFFTTKEVGKGTGLGLSMVYGFVKQSGGHVKIYSEPGDGATVKIYLPRLISGDDAQDEPAPAADRARPAHTVLVVEDDDDVRAYTVEILRELGYRVLEAHDGPSALRLLERRDQAFDLLFTDVVMPGMSGKELVEKARAVRTDLKVLYTSGYTRNAIVHGGRLNNGVEMIAKPFTYQALAEKIADVLDIGRTGRVLVVENEATVRMFAIEALESAGFAVDEAASPSEATARVRAAQGRYDAVLLDADLPERTGGALAAELRAMHTDLPLLIASSEHAEDLRIRFAQDRCISVIEKPYNASKLNAALTILDVRCGNKN